MSSSPAPAALPYKAWRCLACGFVYDEAEGWPDVDELRVQQLLENGGVAADDRLKKAGAHADEILRVAPQRGGRFPLSMSDTMSHLPSEPFRRVSVNLPSSDSPARAEYAPMM